MTLNPIIFRAYDIRGIADIDLKPEVAELIGKAAGTYFLEHFGPKIAVGRDCRVSSPEIQQAFIKGLLSTGCDVIDLGMITSPMVYFAVCHGKLDGGVCITASHNPKEYNGIKLVGKDAHSIFGDDLQNILRIAEEGIFKEGRGALTQRDIFKDYSDKITSVIKPKRSLKVGIDGGNGAAGKYAEEILKALGFEVFEIYTEPDGNFPNHEANPEYAENLKELSQLVKDKKLDLGIGFDGDGDRIGIIDHLGNHTSADFIIMFLARDLLSKCKNTPIVFDSKCSILLKHEIKRLGGIPIMSKTGHSFIENKMKEVGALLGGECSGHLFFGENYYGFDDGIFATAKILEILSNSDKPFIEHFFHLPKTFMTAEIKAGVPDEVKFQVMEQIKDYFVKNYKCLTIDGVRILFDDFSWAAIRCSNTTPCLTMRFEADSQKKLSDIQKIVYNQLKEYGKIDNRWYTELV